MGMAVDKRLIFTFDIPEYDQCAVVYFPNLDGKYLFMMVKEYLYQTYRKDGNTEAWNHTFYTAPGRYIDKNGLSLDFTGNNKALFSFDPKSGIYDSDYYLIGQLTGVAWIRDSSIFFQFQAAEQISNQWSWAAGKRVFLWFSNFDNFYRISDDDTQDSDKKSLFQITLDKLNYEVLRKKVSVFKTEKPVRKLTGIAQYDGVKQYFSNELAGKGMEIFCTYIPIHRFPDKDSEILVSADKNVLLAIRNRMASDTKFKNSIDSYFVSRKYTSNYRYNDDYGNVKYTSLAGSFTGQLWDMGDKGRWLLVEISPLAYRWLFDGQPEIVFDYGFVRQDIAFPNGVDYSSVEITKDETAGDEFNWWIPAAIVAGAAALKVITG
jgi:hypothetical protein